MAVVARAEHVRSLGLDVEPDAPLDPELWNEVCAPAEAAWLAAQPRARRGRLAKLIFSAKECAYKCRYPSSRKLLGFQEVRVRIDLAAACFEAVFDGEPAGGWRGAYGREEGLLIVGMALR
jgi:4'-phosphopantetheinyl transferase EntD